MNIKKNKKSFTLIEVIAVIAILSITLTLTYTLFNNTYTVFNKQEKESILIDEARNFSSILESDIKLAYEVEINIAIPASYGISNTAIGLAKIKDVVGEEFIYTREGSKIVKYKILSGTATKIATLANYIADVQLSLIGEKSYKLYIKINSKDIETYFETVITRRMV